jgi:hypothetical protein
MKEVILYCMWIILASVILGFFLLSAISLIPEIESVIKKIRSIFK